MPVGMKYTGEREWLRFRGTGTGSGETDIEVIGSTLVNMWQVGA